MTESDFDMKKSFVLLFFLLSSVALLAQEDCLTLFNDARICKEQGRYEDAVRALKHVLDTWGDCNGEVNKELKECERVIATFSSAQSKLECEGNDGTFVLQLKIAPAHWTVSSKIPEWLQVSSVNLEEKKVVFNVSANPKAEVRRGIVRLRSDKGISRDFAVYQKEGEPRLSVQPVEMFFGGGGGQQVVTVNANFNWTFDKPIPWLRLTKKNDQLLVTCLPNNDLDRQRNSTVIISGKNMSQSISVTQYEGDTYFVIQGIVNHAINFEPKGGISDNIKIICDEKWHIKNECSWIKVTLLDNSTVVVHCDANPWAESRTGSFEVVTSAEDRSKTILVEQAGAEPEFARISLPCKNCKTGERRVYYDESQSHYREVHIQGDTGVMVVKVHSNVQNWDYRIIPDDVTWITAEAYHKDSLLQINISDNNTWEGRDAKVVFSAMGLQETLMVKQSKRGYSGIINDYFDGGARVWKTTRFFVDVYALESIGLRIGGLAKRWKYVEFSLLDFDVEYAHKSFYLDWEPIVRGYLPLSRNERRWAAYMGMGISVNMLNLAVAPEVKLSYLGTPHFLFELGAEFQWKKREDLSSRIFFRYDGFSSFGFSFDFYQWHSKFSRKK